jgi:FlaA1/EpsC-like NDP-sugar epimerase
LEQGVELVWHAIDDMEGGEIYVRKAPSMKIVDIARAVDPKSEPRIVGIRPGEKLHEQMISAEDAPYTFDYGAHYKIMPAINTWGNETRVKTGQPVAPGFVYRSDTNSEWMTVEALRAWIENNRAKLGQF